MVSGSGDAEGVGLSAFAERTEAVDASISADSKMKNAFFKVSLLNL